MKISVCDQELVINVLRINGNYSASTTRIYIFKSLSLELVATHNELEGLNKVITRLIDFITPLLTGEIEAPLGIYGYNDSSGAARARISHQTDLP